MKFKKFKLKSGGKLITIMALITALTTICSMPAFAMKSSKFLQKKDKKLRSSKTFSQIWNNVTNHLSGNVPSIFIDGKDSIDDVISDMLNSDNAVPQENFTLSLNNKYCFTIDWSNFAQVPASQINTRNLYDISHGIVNYITYYSEGKFNTAELKFFCTGAKKYRDQNNVTGTQKNQYGHPMYDVLNILPINWDSIATYFTVDNELKDHKIVGYWFNRITVNPIGYALRCIRPYAQAAAPCSIRFWGIDENSNKDLLDERLNINDLVPNGSYAFFFCRTTDKQFKAFAVDLFNSSGNPGWPYHIAFFEVHGNVALDPNAPQSSLSFNEDMSSSIFDIDHFDPSIDMTNMMF